MTYEYKKIKKIVQETKISKENTEKRKKKQRRNEMRKNLGVEAKKKIKKLMER